MNEKTTLKQSLSLFDATMIVAGSMIGSGIFIVSADMTRNVGSAGWLIGLWVLTGIMTIFAAVTYGELSAMFPKAGGQYIYLKESYNKLTGFLYGWSCFTVIQTGTIAAVGVAFSKFAGYFIPALTMDDKNLLFQVGGWLKIYPAQILSILLIVFLTYINNRGIKDGKIIQKVFTLAKLFSLFGLIVFGILIAAKADVWNANWATGFDFKFTQPVLDGAGNKVGYGSFQKPDGLMMMLGLISAAMVGSMFSSVAWENVTFLGSEVKNPKKNVGLSLFLGTLIVICIYVLTNIMYISVLPLTPAAAPGDIAYATESVNNIAFAFQDRVATAAAEPIFGTIGAGIIAVMIMISTFGCNNGLILTGSRIFYSMAKDGLFFKNAGTLNKNNVPSWALWAQCIWACTLCLSGKYGLLLDYVVFVTLLFYILTIIGVFILRKKRPDAERPYKAFGYPVIPIIYIIMATLMAIGLLYKNTTTSLWGLGIVILGIPVYYIVNKKMAAPTEA